MRRGYLRGESFLSATFVTLTRVNQVNDTGVSLGDPIPHSRITPPQFQSILASRVSLLKELDDVGERLIYLVAPPGFGKTILASQWLHGGGSKGVWIRADQFDSEERFLLVAVAAFRRAFPDFAQWVDESTLESGEVGIDEVVNRIMRDVETLKGQVRIVVDDADFLGVTNNRVAELFITKFPANCQLMVLREQAPQIHSLKSMGVERLTVISSQQLRFTSDEISRLLAESLQQSSDQLTKLANMILHESQGWPAAVTLMIERLREVDSSDFSFEVTQLTGAETMQRLGSVTREVLLRLEPSEYETIKSLVFLEEITNEVAIDITKEPRTPFILAKLSSGSFFLERISAEPPTYRLNGIIRRALLDEASRNDKELNTLHRKTFEALLEFGEKFKAFDLLTRTGSGHLITDLVRNPEVLSEVIERIRICIYSGNRAELRIWANYLRFLPEPARNFAFSLNFYILIMGGEYEEAKGLLLNQKMSLNSTAKDIGQGEALNRLLVIAHFALGELREAVQLTLEVIRRGASSTRNEIGFSSSTSFLRFGMSAALFTENREALTEIDLFLTANPETEFTGRFQINPLSVGAILAYFEGRLRIAEELALAAISQSKISNLRGFYAPLESYFVLFQVRNEQLRYQEADEILGIAMLAANESGLIPWQLVLQARQAVARAKRGELSLASATFTRVREIAGMRPSATDLSEIVDRNELILQHFLEGGIRIDEIRERLPDTQITRLYRAQKHLRSNQKEFQKTIEKFSLDLPREAINAEVFLVIENFDYPPKAREHLKNALAIAQEHGYYQYLLIQGDRFLSFLISSLAEMPSPFLERLARDAGELLRKKLTSTTVLAEPLTRREADILRHLASERPIAKIASDLRITKNTMKTHLRHLYRKMGANDRHQAVEKGKELLNL